MAPIKPIPRVITYQEDITTSSCVNAIKQTLKTWQADVVLHDGAPNVGQAWVQDAYGQSCLVLASLKLAVQVLGKNGTFVTKVFRSNDYNKILWVLNQLFKHVEATKPPSSRSVSAEIFVVCRGYLDPKKIDPRLLDPKFVFKDITIDEDPQSSMSKAKNALNDILFPERAEKKRKREGYEDGDYLLYKSASVVDFINCEKDADAIQMLASLNQIKFEKPQNIESSSTEESLDPKLLEGHWLTTDEIKECLKDLKVLGRSDFRAILRWRKSILKDLGLEKKKIKQKYVPSESFVEMEGNDDKAEEKPEDPLEELEELEEKSSNLAKKKKKRRLEKLSKDRKRMQLNMNAQMDIGVDAQASSALFHDDVGTDSLNAPNGALFDLADLPNQKENYMEDIDTKSWKSSDYSDVEQEDELIGSDMSEDEFSHENCLENEMEDMYNQYVQQQMSRDSKFRVKQIRAREEEFTGADDSSGESSDEEHPVSKADDDDKPSKSQAEDKAKAQKADIFFSQGIFDEFGKDSNFDAPEKYEEIPHETEKFDSYIDSSDDESEFSDEAENSEKIAENEEKKARVNKLFSTAEAIDMALKMVSDNGRGKEDVIEDYGYTKWSFNEDKSSLPSWFVDDEAKFRKLNRPITKEAVELLKQRQKALDARPIKKVLEAKARKKQKSQRKLDKLKKKMNAMLEEDGPDDPEMGTKLNEMQSMLKKAQRKAKESTRRKVELVVAKGGNKGRKGRPKGVKGRYKMVDSRMKKEVRAIKRKEKATRKRRK